MESGLTYRIMEVLGNLSEDVDVVWVHAAGWDDAVKEPSLSTRMRLAMADKVRGHRRVLLVTGDPIGNGGIGQGRAFAGWYETSLNKLTASRFRYQGVQGLDITLREAFDLLRQVEGLKGRVTFICEDMEAPVYRWLFARWDMTFGTAMLFQDVWTLREASYKATHTLDEVAARNAKMWLGVLVKEVGWWRLLRLVLGFPAKDTPRIPLRERLMLRRKVAG